MQVPGELAGRRLSAGQVQFGALHMRFVVHQHITLRMKTASVLFRRSLALQAFPSTLVLCNCLAQAIANCTRPSRLPLSPSNSGRASEASGSAVSNGQAMSAALSIARSQVRPLHRLWHDLASPGTGPASHEMKHEWLREALDHQ